MSQSPIQAAIQQICQEKSLSEESVIQTIEVALAAAFRKDFGNKMQNIITNFDSKTGGVKVFDVKTVVEDLPEDYFDELVEDDDDKKKSVIAKAPKVADKAYVSIEGEGEDEEEVRRFNPKTEIQLKDAKEIAKKYKVGDEIVTPLEVPGEFGRMAAQTAKQVIIQKLREEERQNIYTEYKELEHQVLNATVQRWEGRNVLIDLGHTTAILPPDEQVSRERYSIGNRMKFYLKSVEQTTRGPQLVVSRVNKDIINKIFEMEIPEVASGVITIKSVAREAGNRSKVAIFSDDDNIDPIGSCVGQRGARIQTIINELNGEKVDIILWNEDSIKFITNAMSPAKVISVKFKDAKDESVEKSAVVTVKEDQLSLAIGKAGQNVRLASKLTGWKLDIISDAVKISDKKEKIVEELTDDKDNGDNEKAEGGEKIDDKEKTAKKKTIKQKDQESEEVDGDKKENKDKKKQEETEKPVE